MYRTLIFITIVFLTFILVRNSGTYNDFKDRHTNGSILTPTDSLMVE